MTIHEQRDHIRRLANEALAQQVQRNEFQARLLYAQAALAATLLARQLPYPLSALWQSAAVMFYRLAGGS